MGVVAALERGDGMRHALPRPVDSLRGPGISLVLPLRFPGVREGHYKLQTFDHNSPLETAEVELEYFNYYYREIVVITHHAQGHHVTHPIPP